MELLDEEDGATEEHDEELFNEDPRLSKKKYDVSLVYASPLMLE